MSDYRLQPITGKNVIDYNWLQIMITPCLILFLSYNILFFYFRLKRYTAYRQFVRWCWHFLGKEVRVVIPSCAVVKIRTAFPDENYTGFHQADSDWNGSISSALLHPCLVCHTRCIVEVVPQCTAGCLHHSCGTLLQLKMLYSLDSQHNLQEKIQIKN